MWLSALAVILVPWIRQSKECCLLNVGFSQLIFADPYPDPNILCMLMRQSLIRDASAFRDNYAVFRPRCTARSSGTRSGLLFRISEKRLAIGLFSSAPMRGIASRIQQVSHADDAYLRISPDPRKSYTWWRNAWWTQSAGQWWIWAEEPCRVP